jgi:hypothetical protein
LVSRQIRGSKGIAKTRTQIESGSYENYKKFAHGDRELLKGIFEAIGMSETRGYISIQLYEFINCEYLKRFPASGNFEQMFENVVDIFAEGNNISLNKIETKYLSNSKAHVSNATGENEWYTPSNFIEAARQPKS